MFLKVLLYTLMTCLLAQSISDLQGTWVGMAGDEKVNMTLSESGSGVFYDSKYPVGDIYLSIQGGLYAALIKPSYNWNNGFSVNLLNPTTIRGMYIHFGSLNNPYKPLNMRKISSIK